MLLFYRNLFVFIRGFLFFSYFIFGRGLFFIFICRVIFLFVFILKGLRFFGKVIKCGGLRLKFVVFFEVVSFFFVGWGWFLVVFCFFDVIINFGWLEKFRGVVDFVLMEILKGILKVGLFLFLRGIIFNFVLYDFFLILLKVIYLYMLVFLIKVFLMVRENFFLLRLFLIINFFLFLIVFLFLN